GDTMRIVTDSATDTDLLQDNDIDIPIIPLKVNLGKTVYRDKIDISPDDFYKELEKSKVLPTTSQPSAGEFAEVYRKIAKEDPDILSIHMSSGLSGTVNSALAAVKMVPEANITVVDTKTLSAAAGWQVWAAVKGLKLGWSKDQILEKIKEIADATSSLYTLKELKYLIHGGRISHIKGLLASVLNIKPLIGVHKTKGNYIQLGQARTFKKALDGLVNLIGETISKNEKMRVQVVHTGNPEGAQVLKDKIDNVFNCQWLPIGQISFVLGAHTGPSMVGVGFAKASVFSGIS
ncbi:MAG: DegV family protein, partial [Anaerolineaceae bacterium]|nr:DegV family protein [Anaerolineaceae bacterium]